MEFEAVLKRDMRDLRSLLAVLTVRNYCLQMSRNIVRMPKEL